MKDPKVKLGDREYTLFDEKKEEDVPCCVLGHYALKINKLDTDAENFSELIEEELGIDHDLITKVNDSGSESRRKRRVMDFLNKELKG